MSNADSTARSVLDLISGTPMLELSRILEQRGLRCRLLAKLETANPVEARRIGPPWS